MKLQPENTISGRKTSSQLAKGHFLGCWAAVFGLLNVFLLAAGDRS